MLHFATDAPMLVLRPLLGLTSGFAEDAPVDAQRWIESIVHIDESDGYVVLEALRTDGYRVEGRKPARQAVNDPTFAMAAAAIERGGTSGAPAAARAW